MELLENFGWPCYEGNATTDYSGSSICTLLYSQPAATTDPYYMYDHQQEVVIGDPGGVGSGAISGLAFYGSGSYPVNYQGALFFSDNVRNRIWVMFNRSRWPPGSQQSGDLSFGGSEPGGSEDWAGRRSILRGSRTAERSGGSPTLSRQFAAMDSRRVPCRWTLLKRSSALPPMTMPPAAMPQRQEWRTGRCRIPLPPPAVRPIQAP